LNTTPSLGAGPSDPIPGLNLYPLYQATGPCDALECQTRAHVLAVCFEQHCPHAWQRQAAEDRARREEQDGEIIAGPSGDVATRVHSNHVASVETQLEYRFNFSQGRPDGGE
jgi:hypothetical protein